MNQDLIYMIETSSNFSDFNKNCITGTANTGGSATMTNAIYTYPSCTYPWWNGTYIKEESRTEQAYKIIRALMKAEVLEIKNLNQFFTSMDEIIKAL